jgi:hypothetical protein
VAEDRPGIEAAYERSARGRTGWLDRPERLWERRLLDERTRWFVLDRQGIVAGYVCWTARQLEAHAEVRLEVSDLVADDESARRRLLALIGAQRDQVTEVTLEVEAGDPIDRALVDADLVRHGTERVEHALGMLVGGPMLRLLDVARAVEARGYRSNGALDVAVDGAPPQSVEIRDGQARWGPSRGGPLLCVERSTLGAGFLRRARLASVGSRRTRPTRCAWPMSSSATRPSLLWTRSDACLVKRRMRLLRMGSLTVPVLRASIPAREGRPASTRRGFRALGERLERGPSEQ